MTVSTGASCSAAGPSAQSPFHLGPGRCGERPPPTRVSVIVSYRVSRLVFGAGKGCRRPLRRHRHCPHLRSSLSLVCVDFTSTIPQSVPQSEDKPPPKTPDSNRTWCALTRSPMPRLHVTRCVAARRSGVGPQSVQIADWSRSRKQKAAGSNRKQPGSKVSRTDGRLHPRMAWCHSSRNFKGQVRKGPGEKVEKGTKPISTWQRRGTGVEVPLGSLDSERSIWGKQEHGEKSQGETEGVGCLGKEFERRGSSRGIRFHSSWGVVCRRI